MTIQTTRPAHWPKVRPQPRPRKATPAERDIAVINAVFAAAKLETRAGLWARDRTRLVHWMGDPKQGQIIIYVLDRPAGEKINRITALVPELAEALSRARGRDTVPRVRLRPLALELPHYRPAPLLWRDPDGLPAESMRLGRSFDVSGERDVTADLGRLPHVLVSGRTGAGKSILLNGMISSLCLATPPADLRLWLVDPKNRDLMALAGLPHVERAVFRDADADQILRWFSAEIDRRIAAGVTTGPRHVLVIDELASFLSRLGEIEGILKRAGLMGRALGINILAATQRTDAESIGSGFRAQFSARVSGSVASVDEARINVGVRDSGAESLPLGSGRFVMSADGGLVSFQAYYADRPAALVRAVRQRWAGAELPTAAAVGDPAYGDDEIGAVAAAIADHVDAYRANDVSLSGLIRIAFDAGALQAKTPHKGPANRDKINAALERLGGGS